MWNNYNKGFRIGTAKKAVGGKVNGPPHEQGGVPVVDRQGQPATEPESGRPYEIEGGERVFSIEDTQIIERHVAAMEGLEGKQADQHAMQLGYDVYKMIKKQDAENPDAALQQGSGAANAPDNEPQEYIE